MTVTRNTLIALAAITAAFFVASGVLGNHNHGLLGVISDITWGGFLLSALLLIVLGGATLARRRRRPDSTT